MKFHPFKNWLYRQRVALIAAVVSAAAASAGTLACLSAFYRVDLHMTQTATTISNQLTQVPTRAELSRLMRESTERLERRIAETKSTVDSTRSDSKKDLEVTRTELERHFKLAQKDSRRTLCLVCRRSREMRGDSLCIENGCNLQAHISYQGRDLSVPVLPSSEGQSRMTSEEAGYDSPSSLLLYLRDGDSLERVSGNDLTVSAQSKGASVFGGFIIDRRFVPTPVESQEPSWDDIVQAIRDARDSGGEVVIKTLLGPHATAEQE